MCSNSKWFRSAEMKHVMIFTPEECAFDLIHTLGNMGKIPLMFHLNFLYINMFTIRCHAI